MPLLNDADMIYMGANEAAAVYHGSELVWESNPYVQSSYEVTAGAWNDGKYTYQGYSLHTPTAGAISNTLNWLGGEFYTVSSLSLNGYTILQIRMNVPGCLANDPASKWLSRVYVSSYGWIPASAFVQDSGSTDGIVSWTQQAIVQGEPYNLGSPWVSGQKYTLIFEYLK